MSSFAVVDRARAEEVGLDAVIRGVGGVVGPATGKTFGRQVIPGGGSGRRVRRLAALLGLAVVTAACSNDSAEPPDDRVTTTTDEAARSTTSTTASPEDAACQEVEHAECQEVIDALLAADDAFNRAAAIPDPDFPLEETHTELMLGQSRRVLETLAADGVVIEYPVPSQQSTTVRSVRFEQQFGDEVAFVEECSVDDGRRVRQATGEVVRGGGVSTVRSTNVMVREDGVWKLAERTEDERQDGVAACPDDS